MLKISLFVIANLIFIVLVGLGHWRLSKEKELVRDVIYSKEFEKQQAWLTTILYIISLIVLVSINAFIYFYF